MNRWILLLQHCVFFCTIQFASAIFWGCQCHQPPPCMLPPLPCPLPPPCPMNCQTPVSINQGCGIRCSNKAKQVAKQKFSRQKRSQTLNTLEYFDDLLGEFPDAEVRHFVEEHELSFVDPKCNSERLRKIIVLSTGRDATVTKRNIQLIAEMRFKHKYNIICSSNGEFSYVTNTDEYCQDVISGKTCYIFRQFSHTALNKLIK